MKHAKKYGGEGEKAGVDVSSSVLSLMTVPIAVIVGYSRVELGATRSASRRGCRDWVDVWFDVVSRPRSEC